MTVSGAALAEKEVKVSVRPTRYLAAGSGPPLVLLHGTGTNAGSGRSPSSRGRSVYVPDLPGFGGRG